MTRLQQDKNLGSYIHVRAGGTVDPLDLQPEDIRIEDIAHALSNQCRFQGHTIEFYSVAQHCVLVAGILPPELKLSGLLHDAAEAYLQDMARPLKSHPTLGQAYRGAEQRAERVIFPALGVPYPIPGEVKLADYAVFATEVRDVMGAAPLLLRWVESMDVKPIAKTIVPWTPKRARREFLLRYEALKEEK